MILSRLSRSPKCGVMISNWQRGTSPVSISRLLSTISGKSTSTHRKPLGSSSDRGGIQSCRQVDQHVDRLFGISIKDSLQERIEDAWPRWLGTQWSISPARFFQPSI
jgi:hypothetical protein